MLRGDPGACRLESGAVEHLRPDERLVIVEGQEPEHHPRFGADLAAALGLPVILVVGLRLGCLSHALLTAEAVSARGLRLAGWIANHIEPNMTHAQDNIDTLTRALQQRHAAPLLGVVEYLVPVTDARVADQLEVDAVLEALGLAD